MANQLLDRLRAVGALKEGHFLLSSGKHSDRYVEKFDLLRRPGDTEFVCREIAARYRADPPDVVAGPTTGGILLAFEVARQLGLPAAYAERVDERSPSRAFRRGQTFAPGTRALVVDDILTTGGSVSQTLVALRNAAVEVVGIAVLVDRSGGGVSFGAPLFALASLEIEAWDAKTCPLCTAGVPLTKPGTTPTAA